MIMHGEYPYLECSSRGDKRFSAFFARIKNRDDRTIEDIYQSSKIFSDGSTGLDIMVAKRKGKPINAEYCKELYAKLWDEYIAENPDLIPVLLNSVGLSDIFGQQGHCCQATELWRIRNYHLYME